MDCLTLRRALLIYSFNKYLLNGCDGKATNGISVNKIKLDLCSVFEPGGKGLGVRQCVRERKQPALMRGFSVLITVQGDHI